MDISQLQYFKVIAETGSLTKAAEIMHVSQPAMSAMLKKFEEELNAELFDRSPNRISLNQTGEIALAHVNNILQSIEQMKNDLLCATQQNQKLSIAFCDPGVRWFCVPRFSVACPEISIEDELYQGENAVKMLSERAYDIVVTPDRIQVSNIQSLPFLHDRVFLSVPDNSRLVGNKTISMKDIPAQPLLYPQIGGHFLAQIEKIISENRLPVTLVKNEYNITQYLIRTTNFLATISTLSIDLRNDGSHRTLIPMDDPELNVIYYISFLKTKKEKVKKFLEWAKEIKQEMSDKQTPLDNPRKNV